MGLIADSIDRILIKYGYKTDFGGHYFNPVRLEKKAVSLLRDCARFLFEHFEDQIDHNSRLFLVLRDIDNSVEYGFNRNTLEILQNTKEIIEELISPMIRDKGVGLGLICHINGMITQFNYSRKISL